MKKIHCFKDFYLKILLPSDVTMNYIDWINNDNTNKYLFTKKITLEECKKYVLNKYNNKTCIFYGIYDKNEHIGNIKLEEIDNELKCGCLGIIIGNEKYRNKGYGTKIIKFFSKYLSETLNINIIVLGVLKQNIGAINCYKKCNFVEIKDINNKLLLKKVNNYLIKHKFPLRDDNSVYMILFNYQV